MRLLSGGNSESTERVANLFMNALDAPRVLNAVRRAATLCGAQGSAF